MIARESLPAAREAQTRGLAYAGGAPFRTSARGGRHVPAATAAGEPRLECMGRAVKTEAVVLRSMRFGEADRILHLYTPGRGRVGAIARGVRRSRSRFGGRLEPFFRLRIELHEGRGELLTVTGAETVDGHARLREDARALDAAARACDAVGRRFESSEPHPGVFNLLCRKLALLDEQAGRSNGSVIGRAGTLAFRLKLLLAAGLPPQLAARADGGGHDGGRGVLG